MVFSGNLFQPWALGDTLHINLTTPFTYDPANGNLLMDVVATNTTAPGGRIFFDTNGYNNGNLNGNTIMGRGSDIDGFVVGFDSGYGLVTRFSTPEPSTLLLLGAGLAGVGIMRRVRK